MALEGFKVLMVINDILICNLGLICEDLQPEIAHASPRLIGTRYRPGLTKVKDTFNWLDIFGYIDNSKRLMADPHFQWR